MRRPLVLREQIVANGLDMVLAGEARAVDELCVIGDVTARRSLKRLSDTLVEGG